MKKLLLLAVLATLAVFVPSAGAITGNYHDDFEHDYVGLLVFYDFSDADGDGDIFVQRCSGTLISPTIVVTAGHCVENLDDGRIYWAQSVAPNYDPTAFGGLGGDPTTGYPYKDFGPKDTSTFSRADNFGFPWSFPDTKDLGVVVLDKPYTPPSGKFGILPSVGAVTDYVNSTQYKQDLRFVSSGYGVSDHDPVDVSFRKRLWAYGYYVQDTSGVTDGYNLQVTANPSKGKGGTCHGDSGGPVFFEGTRIIAAVTSFGMNGQCKGLDFSYRIDRPETLAWITDPNRADINPRG